eukprot:TRINITY_DN51905_c0_g1_i1.p1 TRINITY_DN51905_c0_g1~~TRINITY_DN51905_c0_g1_i1.p1  ORF type:complete len:260 (+),score=28.64 TRINITY_DN51905_c0_g1_i1:55-834(+)
MHAEARQQLVTGAGTEVPGSVMVGYTDKGRNRAIFATHKPCDAGDIVTCLSVSPPANTLILSGSHGNTLGHCSFLDMLIHREHWSLQEHGDGHQFFLEDLEALKHYFPRAMHNDDLRNWDRVRPGENFKPGKVGFLRTAVDFCSVKDVKRIFTEFPEQRRDPHDDVPYTFQGIVNKYSSPGSPFGEISIDELKKYWESTCLPHTSDCTRRVAEMVTSGIVDFCQKWDIEMIICAYCYSTNSPLTHEVAKRLGVLHTVFS